MNFINNLNTSQKIIAFILVINIFMGIPIYNELQLTYIRLYDGYVWSDLFTSAGIFWWGVNFAMLIGIFLFKDKEV